MSDWFALTYVLNSLNRSVGMPDAYPFALSSPVIEKLGFVHEVILEHYRARHTSVGTEVENRMTV
jgi:hypothetical protein